MSMGDVQVPAPSLNYKQQLLSHGKTQLTPVFSNQYGSPIALNAGQSNVVFNLPSEVMNLHDSYLVYQVSLPAPATAGRYIWYAADTIAEISHIQLYGSNNQFIADLDNSNVYYKIVGKHETSMEEFLSHDQMNRLYPSNVVNNVVPALRPQSTETGAPAASIPSSKNYVEPAYFEVGALNTAVTLQVQIPLKNIKNTIFSMDKLLFFNQVIYLKIFFGPISRICYMSASNASPFAAAPAAYDGVNPVIQNLQLLLAVETNPSVRERVMSAARSGMSLIIPYVQSYNNSVSGTVQSVNLSIDAGQGRTLLKMYHSLFNNTPSLSTMYDCANLPMSNAVTETNCQKLNQYYTQLNGARVQTLTLDCTPNGYFTDYTNQKDSLKDSVIQNRDIFQYNWHHLDDWSGFSTEYVQNGESYLTSGVALGGTPITWTFIGTTRAAAMLHYTFGVFTKRLTISETGPMVD